MPPRPVYQLTDSIPDVAWHAFAYHHPLAAQLLHARGVRTPDDAERFLRPSYDDHLHDPFLLTDMSRAIERILRAIRNNEHIAIYTDYDCDGIPGGVLLHDFFHSLNFHNFENYIPHRHDEGYGFNAPAVTKLKERGTSLIITVDCGIVDFEAASHAREIGVDVIITDHHEPSGVIPDAYAVINPKRDNAYPFPHLCGTAVAYKLVQAVLARGRAEGVISLREGMEKWWLDMVGLATIADMVPLIGENRVFAQYGIRVLRKSKRPGLQHLLRAVGSSQTHLTEDDIGFTIAPRINAASRMDNPEDAFHLLRTKDEAEAGRYVDHLEHLNNERKGIVASMTREAKRRLHLEDPIPSVIVMGDPEWRPSLVGLVANALAEEYLRPTFLWGRDGRGVLKGSCRSGGGLSTLRLMEAVPHAFTAFGGHHASGGFSLTHEQVHHLRELLNAAYETIGAAAGETVVPVRIDAELSLSEITESFIALLDALAPYGERNPKPLFRIRDVVPSRVFVFGKSRSHTKLIVARSGVVREAVAFFKIPEEFAIVPEVDKPLTLIGHIERSYYMGNAYVRIRIVDIA